MQQSDLHDIDLDDSDLEECDDDQLDVEGFLSRFEALKADMQSRGVWDMDSSDMSDLHDADLDDSDLEENEEEEPIENDVKACPMCNDSGVTYDGDLCDCEFVAEFNRDS